jgi:hypothetical protein
VDRRIGASRPGDFFGGSHIHHAAECNYTPTAPIQPPVQPVVVAPAAVVPVAAPAPVQEKAAYSRREPNEVIVFSHSNFFYWRPVWVVGCITAILSRFGPGATQVNIGGRLEWFNTSKALGVIFTLTCFLVILITNVLVRGLASLVAVLCIVLAVVISLYFGWWEQLAIWFNLISIHMNMGF